MFNENKLYYMTQGSSVNSRLLYFIVLVFFIFFFIDVKGSTNCTSRATFNSTNSKWLYTRAIGNNI